MEQCPDFAQTDWYNPFGKGEIPVQGRCWNEEIGAKYHRLPDRAEKVVRKALWDLSCQSAGLYIKFKTNASENTGEIHGYIWLFYAAYAGNGSQWSRFVHEGC